MTPTAYVILSILVLMGGWAAWDVVRAARMVWRLRGPRVVTCPRTGLAAAVEIDLAHAFATGLVESAPNVRVIGCSRWTGHGQCEEHCVSEAAEMSSTASTIVAHSVTGQPC